MSSDKLNTLSLYWLKRDFRLFDNPAFTAALAESEQVIPIFFLEPSFVKAPETSAFHVHAVSNALKDLRLKFQNHGKDVAVICGEVVSTLEILYKDLPFQRIYAHEEIGIERTFARDRAVHKWCKEKGVVFEEYRQTGVFRRMNDRDKRHKKWFEFTHAPLLPAPTSQQLQNCCIPEEWQYLTLRSDEHFSNEQVKMPLSTEQKRYVQAVSETDAENTLLEFFYRRGIAYRGGISSPISAFTAGSRMSVHLAWGTMTGRTLYQRTKERLEELKIQKAEGDPDAGRWSMSLRSFLSRLHWRDHFIQRLESEPNMEFEALNSAYQKLEYDNDEKHLKAWINGTTGFPMVDACIRCLQTTGFVNFRMRAMLTSFACHTLSIDWRLIDHPMAKLYTDYEPGIHISQLQMQASVVGINTVRIYSPTKQIVDQDPETVFIKQWIPELREFTPADIIGHRDEQLGDYPAQIVDWKEASSEMRRRIFAIRKTENYREIAKKVYEKHGSRKASPTKRKKAAAKRKKDIKLADKKAAMADLKKKKKNTKNKTNKSNLETTTK